MLVGDNPHVISAAIRMENPLILDSRGGQKETFFDYESGYNPETDEFDGEESGLLLDFINAWNEELDSWEWDGYVVRPYDILEFGYDGGITASQLESKAREILDNAGIQNSEGELASGEFLRLVFERMGFDGIVDNNVNMKFGTQRKYGQAMAGLDYGVSHIIAFHPSQIKQTDPVTYDNNGKVIPLSERFNPENDDIRFSMISDNEKKGIDALEKIAQGTDVVRNAMSREDLAKYEGETGVSFYWGEAGDPSKGFKKGYGIAHIGAKHGPDAVIRAIGLIDHGKIDRYVKGNRTVVLTDGEYEAVLALTKSGEKETWLLNGWERKEKADGVSEVSAQSDPTQTNPTFSREDLGAAISQYKNSKYSQEVKKSDNKKNRSLNIRESIDRGGLESVVSAEDLNDFSAAEGDFYWGVAYHPYPQDLTKPAFWNNDTRSTYDENSAYCTFKNLEVVDHWIRQKKNMYKGSTKRILFLSENGTNSPSYSESDLALQAAGAAWALKKVYALEGIDAIQWHNWMDNRYEGGLRIGLRKFSDEPGDPAGIKPVWNVYQAAGTSSESAVFDPYLKTIGINSWEETLHKF